MQTKIQAYKEIQKNLEFLINATSSGEEREKYCDINISIGLKIMQNEKHSLGCELTIEYLNDNKNSGKIFASGTTIHKGLHSTPIRWLAKVGGGHDWAIYYGLSSWSWDMVRTNGDKVFSDAIIKELVPCTDEALKRYRK